MYWQKGCSPKKHSHSFCSIALNILTLAQFRKKGHFILLSCYFLCSSLLDVYDMIKRQAKIACLHISVALNHVYLKLQVDISHNNQLERQERKQKGFASNHNISPTPRTFFKWASSQVIVFPQIQLSRPHTYIAKTTAIMLVLLSSKIASEKFLTTPGKTSFRISVTPCRKEVDSPNWW